MVALVLASWLGKAFIFNSEGPWGSQSSSQNFQEVSISVCSVGRPHVRPGPDECVLIFASENMLRVTGEREIGKDSSWSPVLGMRWKPRRGSISVCINNCVTGLSGPCHIPMSCLNKSLIVRILAGKVLRERSCHLLHGDCKFRTSVFQKSMSVARRILSLQ